MFLAEVVTNPDYEPKSSLVVRHGIAFTATAALGFFFWRVVKCRLDNVERRK